MKTIFLSLVSFVLLGIGSAQASDLDSMALDADMAEIVEVMDRVNHALDSADRAQAHKSKKSKRMRRRGRSHAQLRRLARRVCRRAGVGRNKAQELRQEIRKIKKDLKPLRQEVKVARQVYHAAIFTRNPNTNEITETAEALGLARGNIIGARKGAFGILAVDTFAPAQLKSGLMCINMTSRLMAKKNKKRRKMKRQI